MIYSVKLYAVADGNTFDGFDFHGPFEHEEDAVDAAKDISSDWHVVPCTGPHEDESGGLYYRIPTAPRNLAEIDGDTYGTLMAYRIYTWGE